MVLLIAYRAVSGRYSPGRDERQVGEKERAAAALARDPDERDQAGQGRSERDRSAASGPSRVD